MVVQGPATITHQEPTSPAAISRPTIIFSHNFTSHCLLKTSWVNIIMLSQDMSNRQTSQASASMMIISRLNCHKSLISKRELNVMMIWTPSCLGMKHRMIRRVYNTALYSNNLAGCVHGTWIVASFSFINFNIGTLIWIDLFNNFVKHRPWSLLFYAITFRRKPCPSAYPQRSWRRREIPSVEL